VTAGGHGAPRDLGAGRDVRRSGCMVVMYHYVRDSAATPFPAIRALSPELFERQLDWLQAHYTIVDLATLQSSLAGEALLPESAALLTFDDGFIDHYEAVLPVLRRRGVTGTFFLSQNACGPEPRLLGVHKIHLLLASLGAEVFGRAVLAECALSPARAAGSRTVFGADRWEEADDRAIKHLLNYELPYQEADRVLDALFSRHLGDAAAFARGLYLNETMVREMSAAGMVFGYHTRSHRMLSRLGADEQADELRDGVGWIRGLTGQSSVPFCYPWGGPQTYSPVTVRLLHDAGYSLAFNTVRRRAVIGQDHPFELPRLDTRDLPPHAGDEVDALTEERRSGVPVDTAGGEA
jgi:peptidoglycan/xylan/chitin deacetylase (PgdA/CDA1 family)